MKAIGNFTSTESRKTTAMLGGEWTSLQDPEASYEILNDYIEDEELNDNDRWFDIEEDEEGRKFATSGTVDLEYYIEVEYE